jgi:hypothetical protein
VTLSACDAIPIVIATARVARHQRAEHRVLDQLPVAQPIDKQLKHKSY